MPGRSALTTLSRVTPGLIVIPVDALAPRQTRVAGQRLNRSAPAAVSSPPAAATSAAVSQARE